MQNTNLNPVREALNLATAALTTFLRSAMVFVVSSLFLFYTYVSVIATRNEFYQGDYISVLVGVGFTLLSFGMVVYTCLLFEVNIPLSD